LAAVPAGAAFTVRTADFELDGTGGTRPGRPHREVVVLEAGLRGRPASDVVGELVRRTLISRATIVRILTESGRWAPAPAAAADRVEAGLVNELADAINDALAELLARPPASLATQGNPHLASNPPNRGADAMTIEGQ
jgi:hypothetical protein